MTVQPLIESTIFEELHVTPVINAAGIYTDLGGSVLSPRVWSAMQEINSYFVRMPDLLDQSGRVIAALIGVEAARIVPGASAAITLGAAACMAGTDGTKSESLPDTTGMKNEIIIQKRHRYKYDRCARIAGATLIEVGGQPDTMAATLAAAIGPQTAAILLPAHLDSKSGTVPLREVSAIARQHNVPVLVDAAYLNYPIEVMGSFTAAGADLVCYSAKYFGGPNSGGFICGRKDLIEAVAAVDFTRFESGKHLKFGRPFKLDRQILAGVVVALQEWFAMNHQQRWEGYSRKVETIIGKLNGALGVTLRPMYFTMEETLLPEPVNCVAISFDPGSDKGPESISNALAAGSPSIATVIVGDVLVLAMDTILDQQELIVADRLKYLLNA